MIGQLAKAYDVDHVWDYERPGTGLLLTSGTGGMLAGMDSLPMMRWAWVLEGYREVTPSMSSFMEAAAHIASVVTLFGFYGVDSPSIAQTLLGYVDENRIVVYSNAHIGRGVAVESFDDMVRATQQAAACAR